MENIKICGIEYLSLVCKIVLRTTAKGERKQFITVTVFDNSLELCLGKFELVYSGESINTRLTADVAIQQYIDSKESAIHAYNAIRTLKHAMSKRAAKRLFKTLSRVHLFD